MCQKVSQGQLLNFLRSIELDDPPPTFLIHKGWQVWIYPKVLQCGHQPKELLEGMDFSLVKDLVYSEAVYHCLRLTFQKVYRFLDVVFGKLHNPEELSYYS